MFVFREDIVIWVQKKTGTPIITVNTVDEAQRFLKKYHTFALGLFEKFEVFLDIENCRFKDHCM